MRKVSRALIQKLFNADTERNGARYTRKDKREQMENNEFKPGELAIRKYKLLKSEDRHKAVVEETRKRRKSEIQLRHLLPSPDTEIEFGTSLDENIAIKIEEKMTRDITSSSKGKGKSKDKDMESAGPNTVRMAITDDKLGRP
jgi:hypothetical protein